MRGTSIAEMEFHVSSPYKCRHEVGSFLGELFREILSKMEDVDNKPLKKTVKCRLAKSENNLKRKAKKKNKFSHEEI